MKGIKKTKNINHDNLSPTELNLHDQLKKNRTQYTSLATIVAYSEADFD